MKIEFLKSTSARRAQIAHIKALLDDANQARERNDIPAFAHVLAEIDIALAQCDSTKPKKTRLLSVEEGAEIVRRCRDVPQLDYWAKSMAESTEHKENILRIGFEVEMTGGIPSEIGGLV